MLIEDGVIDTTSEPWQIQTDRLVTMRVPPTLTGVLQARIDTLPQSEREAIERAAVVGNRRGPCSAPAVGGKSPRPPARGATRW